jgi:RNA recognition motif-containing protein
VNIYVGNLSFQTTEDELREIFSEYGTVTSVSIVKDKYSGRSRGFGFVEMASDQEGQAAIDALNESEMQGRNLKVNVAKPREEGRDRRPDRRRDDRSRGGDRRR